MAKIKKIKVWSLRRPFIFKHKKWITKNSYYHIFDTMFEMLVNALTILLKRLPDFYTSENII
jgi:hypothetical protein